MFAVLVALRFDPGLLAAQVFDATKGTPIPNADVNRARATHNLERFGCIIDPYEGAPPDSVTRVSFRWGSDFGDENMPLLGGFPNLTTIDFSHTRVCGTRIVNSGFKRLTTLKKLTTLNFNTTAIGNDGLGEVVRCKSLKALFLRNTQITNAGLRRLSGAHNLSELDVSATRITDSGLKELAGVKNLRILVLSRNDVSREAVDGLRRSLPGLQISLRDDF